MRKFSPLPNIFQGKSPSQDPAPTLPFVSFYHSSHLLPVSTSQVVFHTHVCGMWWRNGERKWSFSLPFWFLTASCTALLQAMGAKASDSVSWQVVGA